MPASRETFLDAARRAQALGATDRLVAAALGNSLTVDGAVNELSSSQLNTGPVFAGVTSVVGGVNGGVAQTAAALGNSVSITVH